MEQVESTGSYDELCVWGEEDGEVSSLGSKWMVQTQEAEQDGDGK